MSTSLLYHAFDIRGYRYIRTDYRDGGVVFTVTRKKFNLRCPVCKSEKVIRHGSLPRWFHCLPIGKKATYIKTKIPRLECKECKTIRQSDIGFADPRFTYTKALGRYVLDLARHMTIADVSRHLGLSSPLCQNRCRIYFWQNTTIKLNISPKGKTTVSLLAGSLLGLIAGIVGIGGGIYLVPLIIILGLGTEKEAATCGAIFIWLNFFSGLLSRFQYNSIDLTNYIPLIVAVLFGGTLGSYMGSFKFPPKVMEKVLGLVIIVAIFLLKKNDIIITV